MSGFSPLLPLVAEGDLLPFRVAEGDRRLCLSVLGEGLFPRGGGFFGFWTTCWLLRGFERSLPLGDLLGGAFSAGGLCCSRVLASFVGLVSSGRWASRRLGTAFGLLAAFLSASCFRLASDPAEG